MDKCPECGADLKPYKAEKKKKDKPVTKIKRIIEAKKAKVYSDTVFDYDWKKIRAAIIRRDGYTCQRCGHKPLNDLVLTVHHIKPRGYGGGDNASNLITLCSGCHDYVEVHSLMSKAAIIGSFPGDYYMPKKKVKSKPAEWSKDVLYRPDWSKPNHKKPRNLKPSFHRIYGPIYELAQMFVQDCRVNGVIFDGEAFGASYPKVNHNL